jgi:hypothetical protein
LERPPAATGRPGEALRGSRPDPADLCLIRMSELYPKWNVITTDADDFQVYRRNKREVIPMICPPRR